VRFFVRRFISRHQALTNWSRIASLVQAALELKLFAMFRPPLAEISLLHSGCLVIVFFVTRRIPLLRSIPSPPAVAVNAPVTRVFCD
jgi:hypothetical protein